MVFEGYTGGGGKEVVDGLMSTGDVGRLDEDGRLFVEGRDDEMIVSGGENVFPREVEDLLADHECVEEVAVIGVADDEFGQRLRAFVVLRARSRDERVRSAGPRACEPRPLQGPAGGGLPRAAAAQRDRQGGQAGASGQRLSGASLGRMAAATLQLDLASLRLSPGEGRRLSLEVPIEPLDLGSESYRAEPSPVPVQLTVSRMTGGGYALLLRFSAAVTGPCMRCLGTAAPLVEVEAREVDRPGLGEELDSPYVEDETLDLGAWARDALALAMPVKILCREDCAGLCPVCAADLNEAGPEHHHEQAPDPRWAKLRELRLE